jgi:hypothetical protein
MNIDSDTIKTRLAWTYLWKQETSDSIYRCRLDISTLKNVQQTITEYMNE